MLLSQAVHPTIQAYARENAIEEKAAAVFLIYGTDPLYEKAATALNANMKMAVKIGVKSGASANDELKPQRVRMFYYQSFASKCNPFIHPPAMVE